MQQVMFESADLILSILSMLPLGGIFSRWSRGILTFGPDSLRHYIGGESLPKRWMR